MNNNVFEHEIEICNDIILLHNARIKLSREHNSEEYREVILKITDRINTILYELQKKGY